LQTSIIGINYIPFMGMPKAARREFIEILDNVFHHHVDQFVEVQGIEE
jgi:hypothetical protein